MQLCITMGNLRNLQKRAVTVATISNDSHLWLQEGDILIQRSNSEQYVGVAAVYRGPPREFIYPDLMMKVRIAGCVSSTTFTLFCEA